MEIEAKIEIDKGKFDEINRKIGKPRQNLQRNYVYVFDFGIIRIRSENGKAFLTIKGRNKKSEFSKRHEIECEVPKSFYDRFSKIAFFLGNPFYYEKYRASSKYGSCVVSLDRLDKRYFVEIEGDERDIRNNIEDLALKDWPIRKESYTQMARGLK
jgi:adenylate cyclase class IV